LVCTIRIVKFCQGIKMTDNINLRETNYDSTSESEMGVLTLDKYDFSDVADKADWQIRWEEAYTKEMERRGGTLEDNEKKYQAADMLGYADENGNLREKILLFHKEYNPVTGEANVNFTAIGYDRLPIDIQEAIGSKEKVIGNWVMLDKNTVDLHDTFNTYTKNNEGHSTWEEYRDSKGLGKQEETAIKYVQDVDENAPPRETPSVDGETINLKL